MENNKLLMVYLRPGIHLFVRMVRRTEDTSRTALHLTLKPWKLLEECFSKGMFDVFEFGEDYYREYFINILKLYE